MTERELQAAVDRARCPVTLADHRALLRAEQDLRAARMRARPDPNDIHPRTTELARQMGWS